MKTRTILRLSTIALVAVCLLALLSLALYCAHSVSRTALILNLTLAAASAGLWTAIRWGARRMGHYRRKR